MAHATLNVSQPGQRTLKIEISDGVTSIGRAEGNSVRLRHDGNVSRHHAEIVLREDGYWLHDLTTRNGTTVNGNLVQSEQRLFGGELICLGGTSTIEFCLPEEKQSQQPDNDARQLNSPEKSGDAAVSSASPPEQAKPRLSVTILGIAGGLVVIAIFGGILFATGVFNRHTSRETVAKTVDQPTTSASPSVDESDTTSSPTPEVDLTEDTVDTSPGTKPGSGAQPVDAQILAAKISPKNYKFDPAFVALIGGYVSEYKSAGGYYIRARKYRDAIDKEFVNVQGLPPVFGYVMAMSRTKFLENGEGDVWSLPNSIVKAEGVGPVDVDSSKGTGSTKVAASYIRGLWDVFGKEGFMYAVACYGMSLDEAGKVQQQLELKDPTGEGRYDFWRMKNMGVVKGEQVERVARFFAAGIVIENPQQFGLSEPPVSTLY